MTQFGLRGTVAACALLAHAMPAGAQPFPDLEVFDLGEIVLSANLAPTADARTGATVDVVGDETLRRAPIDALRTLDRTPGVSFSQTGGLGTSATLRIRGLDNRYIGVRIDGIDVTDPSATQTQFDFGVLTSFGLDRVEIVRGSQSALYGSEAIAGVVDITTDTGTDLGFSAETRVEVGSFDTYAASVGLSNGTERGRLAFNVSRVETDGFSTRADDDEDDGFEQTFVTASGYHAFTDTVTLGFSAFWRDSEVEFDRSGASIFGPGDNTGEIFTIARGGRVYAEVEAGGIDHLFAASVFDSDRDDPGGFTTFFDGLRRQYEYLGTATVAPDLAVSFGLDRTEEVFETDADRGETATTSALAEVRWRALDAVDASVTLRYDDPEDFDSELSARAAVAWQATPDTTVRGVLGTGFRAPSLFERFSAFGDPDLDVETSRSAELGVEQRFGEVAFAKATAFYTEIDDLIDFDPVSTVCPSFFGCYAQVDGTTRTRGVELSGALPLGARALLYGNYTYTDAETDGARLVRVPRHDLTLGVEADVTERFTAAVDLQLVADIEPSLFAPADNLVEDYTLIGANFSYDVTERAEAYVRIENAADDEYQTAGGFNTAGSAIYVGLRASF